MLEANIMEVNDLSAKELRPYLCRSEVQLLRYYEPAPGIFLAESLRVIGRALDAGYEPLSMLIEKSLIEGQAKEIIERCKDIPVYVASREVLLQITGFGMTQGVLCVMRRRVLPSVEEVCRGAARIAVLEDVVNPTNVGAIFRCAAALNFDAVLLTPACCDPLYRRSVRVSMGTVFQIPWTYLDVAEPSDAGERRLEPSAGAARRSETEPDNVAERKPEPSVRAVQRSETELDNAGERRLEPSAGAARHPEKKTNYVGRLKRMGFAAAAMALREDSLSVDDPRPAGEKRLAVILGTEGEGLRDSTIKACDYTVMIPMTHGVDSLNVAAASAVAFWQLGKRM